jgi:hypothetical protein
VQERLSGAAAAGGGVEESSAVTTAPEPSSMTILRIWMRAVPFMPPIIA